MTVNLWWNETDKEDKEDSRYHFAHHKPHADWCGTKAGRPGWKTDC